MYSSFPSESLNCDSVVWTIVENVPQLCEVNESIDRRRATSSLFVLDCEQPCTESVVDND